MAGYVFSIGEDKNCEIIKKCVKNGYYSTNMSPITDKSRNLIPFEATFSDYCSMKPGDNVYFFSKRKIYGIGEMIKIGCDCKFQNYPNSTKPIQMDYSKIKSSLILNENEESINNRWLCIFKPSPYFFTNPVDMDDVLSYKPNTFKSLRTFWKKSFTKLTDEENNSLKEFILLHNQGLSDYFDYSNDFQSANNNKFNNIDYTLSYQPLLDFTTKDDVIKHEMALESSILLELSNNPNTVIGKWDYLSHQVEASPFKPIDYMDKIDIFGYRFLPNSTIISKYLIIENKNEEADINVAEQISKYIDWIVTNYAYGNYDMIESYIIAPSFSEELLKQGRKIVERNYITSSHPTKSDTWNNLKFISYTYKNSNLNLKEEEN